MTDSQAPGISLRNAALANGVSLDRDQIDALHRYRDEIVEQNRRFNLVGTLDASEIERVLILGSLDLISLIETVGADPIRLIDVGTGAGVPGVPLKIALGRRVDVTLLDANGKKVSFLSHVIGLVGDSIAGTVVVNARAEDAGRAVEHREVYDYVTARAVGSVRMLAELCLPFARVGGVVLLPRGPNWEEETKAASGAIASVGGRLRPFDAAERETGIGSTIILEKVAPTPPRFPRRVGLPGKRPL
ncbi:MAG: 16S rRNA (guanine(527)-N(7))-methyltransferase RsmG [Dehalococcoidia bacterium]|jgi:16S rRNA (guanine527-N7)-methyltransferase|nr:16S rRNA (guanine(527)-N(7))-methyltransferase RsmG [Dehalococcoidia bacterium]